MDLKKVFGILFTLLGTALLLVSAYAMIAGSVLLLGLEIQALQSIITAVLGIIFFTAGVKFIR